MKVREAIRLIEDDGWYRAVTRGSHRQYKHPRKPGRSPLQENHRTTLRPAH
jgi:predicted RNA binding protein YcfA (HicA-like mRNA interferase family)